MSRPGEVDVSVLSAELRVDVPTLLSRAGVIIDRRFREGGHDAITGLSTGVRPSGANSVGFVTAALAELLRAETS